MSHEIFVILQCHLKLHVRHLARTEYSGRSVEGGRGAQSGARQHIQKLQEVNDEADLLGRPFVRTSSTCTCHSFFVCSIHFWIFFCLVHSGCMSLFAT